MTKEEFGKQLTAWAEPYRKTYQKDLERRLWEKVKDYLDNRDKGESPSTYATRLYKVEELYEPVSNEKEKAYWEVCHELQQVIARKREKVSEVAEQYVAKQCATRNWAYPGNVTPELRASKPYQAWEQAKAALESHNDNWRHLQTVHINAKHNAQHRSNDIGLLVKHTAPFPLRPDHEKENARIQFAASTRVIAGGVKTCVDTIGYLFDTYSGGSAKFVPAKKTYGKGQVGAIFETDILCTFNGFSFRGHLIVASGYEKQAHPRFSLFDCVMDGKAMGRVAFATFQKRLEQCQGARKLPPPKPSIFTPPTTKLRRA